MHILATENLNVKSRVSGGLNFQSFPFTQNPTIPNSVVRINNTPRLFAQIAVDAVVLNPGVSIGVEVFVRKDSLPLFNISLTKVFDIRRLGSLFGKVNQTDL